MILPGLCSVCSVSCSFTKLRVPCTLCSAVMLSYFYYASCSLPARIMQYVHSMAFRNAT